MGTKIGALLSSIRFWAITFASLAAILNGQEFLTVVQAWLAAIVTVGSMDSAASRIGGK